MLAIGREAHRTLAYLYPTRVVIGVPHSTGAHGQFPKLFQKTKPDRPLLDSFKPRLHELLVGDSDRCVWTDTKEGPYLWGEATPGKASEARTARSVPRSASPPKNVSRQVGRPGRIENQVYAPAPIARPARLRGRDLPDHLCRPSCSRIQVPTTRPVSSSRARQPPKGDGQGFGHHQKTHLGLRWVTISFVRATPHGQYKSRIGWGTGIRTPACRSRVCCPTTRRSPSGPQIRVYPINCPHVKPKPASGQAIAFVLTASPWLASHALTRSGNLNCSAHTNGHYHRLRPALSGLSVGGVHPTARAIFVQRQPLGIALAILRRRIGSFLTLRTGQGDYDPGLTLLLRHYPILSTR